MRAWRQTSKAYLPVEMSCMCMTWLTLYRKKPELQEEIDQAFEAAANEIERDNDRFTEKILRAEDMDVDVLKPHTGRYKPIKELKSHEEGNCPVKKGHTKKNQREHCTI